VENEFADVLMPCSMLTFSASVIAASSSSARACGVCAAFIHGRPVSAAAMVDGTIAVAVKVAKVVRSKTIRRRGGSRNMGET